MIKLQKRSGGEVVRKIDQPRISMGRDGFNDIVVDDGRISGFHANLFYEDGRLACVDLGSANGTFINGTPVQGRTELKAWDILKLGDTELEVVDSDSRRPTSEQPVVADETLAPDVSLSKESNCEPFAILKLISGGPYPKEYAICGTTVVGRLPEKPFVVDLGTDTTIDVGAKKKEYLGGVIAPGIATAAARLIDKAAMLAQVGLSQPECVIGRNTEDAIRSGLFYGAVCQVDGIVDRITSEWARSPRVIATGGLAGVVSAAARTIAETDQFLTLKGLETIYSRTRK